jgi:hypothetical protein
VSLERIIREAKDIRKGEPLDKAELKTKYGFIEIDLNRLLEGENELREHRSNPWGGPNERFAREKVIDVVGNYAVAAAAHMELCLRWRYLRQMGIWPYGLSEDSSLAAALKVFDDFRDIIEAEMKRVYALLDRHFESITLQA